MYHVSKKEGFVKQSDQEIVNGIIEKLSLVGEWTPSAISTGTIEAIDKNGQKPGFIWACSDKWAWHNSENNKGGSVMDIPEAWKSLSDSMTSE